MAISNVTQVVFSFFLFIFMSCACITAQSIPESQPQEPWFKPLNLTNTKDKLAMLHFYVHDALGPGPNRTVWEVAQASITNTSQTNFGQIIAIDDLLTAEPNRDSMTLGRAQGIITSADLQVPGLAMNINFYFTAGEFSGSSLCVLGRNQILNANRELPIVGGTGVFRMARGYSISNTYSYDVQNSYGILEYTVYVVYKAFSV